MRPDDWHPREGMLFVVPDDYNGTTVFRVGDLNILCRCDDCPCYSGAIEGLHCLEGYVPGWWAGQFSLAELRTFDFAPDNFVTEPDPRELIRNKTGFFHYATAGEPIQGALL